MRHAPSISCSRLKFFLTNSVRSPLDLKPNGPTHVLGWLQANSTYTRSSSVGKARQCYDNTHHHSFTGYLTEVFDHCASCISHSVVAAAELRCTGRLLVDLLTLYIYIDARSKRNFACVCLEHYEISPCSRLTLVWLCWQP